MQRRNVDPLYTGEGRQLLGAPGAFELMEEFQHLRNEYLSVSDHKSVYERSYRLRSKRADAAGYDERVLFAAFG